MRTTAFCLAVVLLGVATAPVTLAQTPQAHVHGLLKLDVAIDGATLTLAIDSPLDHIVGFERAPRSEAETKAVEKAVAQLRTASALFRIDPAAGCKVGQIDLDAPALGLGEAPRGGGAPAHADLEASYTFRCADASKVRFIDLPLLDAFPGVRQVEAQVAAPQGQFKRSVTRPAKRLAWGA